MDLESLAKLVIQKFHEADGYSELDEVTLYKVVHKQLKKVYELHLYNAQKILKAEEEKGYIPDISKYEAEYANIEDAVMECANKIAAVTPEEI